MKRTQYNELGQEIPDTTRPVLPAGWDRAVTLQERIKQAIRTYVSEAAQAEGQESFEEADDFEVDDEEPEWASPYELVEMLPEGPRELQETLDGSPGTPPATPVQETPLEAKKGPSVDSSGAPTPSPKP